MSKALFHAASRTAPHTRMLDACLLHPNPGEPVAVVAGTEHAQARAGGEHVTHLF
jgi:hypothetical protein